MNLPGMSNMKTLPALALAFVILVGAVFLVLPIVVGGGATGYPIEKTDHIATWSWKGVYLDGAQKQADVTKEISTLKGMLGKKGVSDYDIDVGIASQYELLGDGKSAYQYLSKAIALDPKRGLAYMNMGHLMEEMGAFTTAHKAYDAAVAAEPTNPIYKTSQENFLIHHTQTTATP